MSKRNMISWLRTLQEIDEAMNARGLTEYEIPVETVRRAQIDGGYPTMQSMEEVATRFNLYTDFGYRMARSDEIPPATPMCKFRRITA